jgi:hypothetical protein
MEVTTQTRSTSTVERHNQQLAELRIEAALARAALTHAPITVRTARVIAAAVHAGAHTELARFAATGQCDRRRAQQELTAPTVPRDWAAALAQHFESSPHLEQESLDGAA